MELIQGSETSANYNLMPGKYPKENIQQVLLAFRIFAVYRISRPIRRTVIFSLEILEKNNDECILILVIYWKKTGLLHTKISNHNIIYSS